MRIYTALISFLILALTSCGHGETSADEYSIPLYSPEYASGFDIKGAEGKESSIITVRNPWQGADSVSTRLFIARNGEAAPNGFEDCVLNGEARRIVTMSSSHIAMLDALGATDRIVGVSGLKFISNSYIQAHRDSIADVGYDGNVNYELILSLSPDLVLIYGVNGESPMTAKLKELNIPYMYVADYLEESPLGKAEWLVAMAEIIGQRPLGESVFSHIPQNYNALKQRATEANLPAPKVMINTPYNDIWYMPSSESYAVRLIEDAGGKFLYDKNNGNTSVGIDLEEAYMLASDADIWLYPGTAGTLAEVKTMVPKFTDTPPFVNGMIFNNNLRSTPDGGNDYYESGIVHPDLMLRDLIKIFHPELVSEDFIYHKQLK